MYISEIMYFVQFISVYLVFFTVTFFVAFI